MSVIWTCKHYFLFDSHSRDNNGKIGPDGFSVLLKFSSRKSLEQHILETYFLDVNEEYVCFAVQYIKIQLDNALNFDAKLTYRLETEKLREKSETVKKKCRKRKQTETEKAKYRERKQTETEKEKCRQRKQTETEKEKCRERKQTETEKEKCRERKQTETEKAKCRQRKQTETEKAKCRERRATKNLNVSRVSVFKNAIKEGPYYICVVCHSCLYKQICKKICFHTISSILRVIP